MLARIAWIAGDSNCEGSSCTTATRGWSATTWAIRPNLCGLAGPCAGSGVGSVEDPDGVRTGEPTCDNPSFCVNIFCANSKHLEQPNQTRTPKMRSNGFACRQVEQVLQGIGLEPKVFDSTDHGPPAALRHEINTQGPKYTSLQRSVASKRLNLHWQHMRSARHINPCALSDFPIISANQ